MTQPAEHFMPFFVGDFLASTMLWTGPERGLYLQLLAIQWSAGALPDDIERLAQITAYSIEEFTKLWRKVGPKFRPNAGALSNQRLEQVRLRNTQIQNVRSAKGRKAALSRWKVKKNAPSIAPGSAPSIATGISGVMPNECHPNRTEPYSEKRRAAPAGEVVLHDSLPRQPWTEWLEWRRKRKWPVDAVTLTKQLNVLKPFDSETQAKMIDTSIQANWQGIFVLKTPGAGVPKKPYKPPRSVAEMIADEEAANASK